MRDKNLPDAEIIKALECCIDVNGANCHKCPYDKCCSYPESVMLKDTLDLINRQEAEIERLKKDSKDIDEFARNICKERLLQGKAIADFESLRRYIEMQKAEAYKEFAEKVKAEFCHGYTYLEIGEKAFIKDIDNLLKEMEGENDEG